MQARVLPCGHDADDLAILAPEELAVGHPGARTRFHFGPAFAALVAGGARVCIGRRGGHPPGLEHLGPDARVLLAFG